MYHQTVDLPPVVLERWFDEVLPCQILPPHCHTESIDCEIDGPDLVIDLGVGEEKVEWEGGVGVRLIERDILQVGHADQTVCFLPNFWREVEESERFERHARVIICI
jgi:hypothetical protein